MNLYSARVRLAGNLLNEVNKEDLTPGDIIILLRDHGDDAVVNVKHTGLVERESHEEYDRLATVYGEDKVAKAFGQKFAARIPEQAVGLPVEPEPMAEEPRQRRTVTLNKGK